MNTHDEAQKIAEVPRQKAKPRFRIEKLEERIAPHHRVGHYPAGHGGYYDSGPPGHQLCHPKPPCKF